MSPHEHRPAVGRSRHPYDVAPDGQSFLVIRRAPDSEPDGAVVVTNWTSVLKGEKR
jgi:hypothetical protein